MGFVAARRVRVRAERRRSIVVSMGMEIFVGVWVDESCENLGRAWVDMALDGLG